MIQMLLLTLSHPVSPSLDLSLLWTAANLKCSYTHVLVLVTVVVESDNETSIFCVTVLMMLYT